MVDKVLVEKIAGLSRLNFTENELQTFSAQLSKILDHMKALDDVKVDGVAPMFHGCVEEHELAADNVEAFDSKAITKNSLYIEKDFFCVPNILGEDN